MTLTARALNTHEMAVEAALARLQRRWQRLGIQPANAETDLVAALLPTMMEVATLDTADVAKQLPESIVAAGAPAAFVTRLAVAVRSRLAASASAVVTALRRGDSPRMVARAQVAGVRSTGVQTVAAVASATSPVEIVWHASGTCTHQFCLDLSGKRVPFGSTFPGGLDGPPGHPNCSCFLTVVLGPSFDMRSADGALKERVRDVIQSRQAVALTAAADGPGWLSVVCIEGLETPDHRMVEKGSMNWRTLPLPITWAPTCDDHENDVVVGQITEMWREDDEIRARGTWDTSDQATEARRLVDEQVLRWVSMVIDEPRAWELRETPEGCAEDVMADPDGMTECTLTEVVLDADIAKVTLVDHPAFPGSVIVPGDAEIPPLTDRGRTAAEVAPVDDVALPVPEVVAASGQERRTESFVACAARSAAPGLWFNDNPHFTEKTPVTITDEGQIYGHFAPIREHISGLGPPPRDADYDSAFHIHDYRTAEGATIQVGYIIGGVGHPDDIPRTLTIAEAQQFYAGPGSILAGMVRAGEDEFGTWMVGAVSYDLTEEERHQLSTFKFSGDWRRLVGAPRWTLVMVASGIFVPGYPSARSSALVAAGSTTSLITVSE